MSDMKDAKRGQGYDAESQWAHQEQQKALEKLRQQQKGGGGDGDKSDKGKSCGAGCKGGKAGKCKGKAGCPKCAENAKK